MRTSHACSESATTGRTLSAYLSYQVTYKSTLANFTENAASHDMTNDCVPDCNGEWGGDAEFDDCGIYNLLYSLCILSASSGNLNVKVNVTEMHYYNTILEWKKTFATLLHNL